MSQIEEVRIQPIIYVEVTMPSGVVQVFERPVHAEVATVGTQGPSGAPGIDGLPGPPGQSAILGTWEGVWSASEQYPALGLVQYQGSTYLNSSGFLSPLGDPPPSSPAWELVAAAGVDVAPFMYTHNQLIPTATWAVTHGLGGFPNVTAVDSTEREIVGDVQYINSNQLLITFSSATGGKAYIS